MNMQSVVFQDSQDQSQSFQESQANITEGQELNDSPESSESSGQGYMEMGKVYKDPSTGKLIMVEG